jgi:hypothetical protein
MRSANGNICKTSVDHKNSFMKQKDYALENATYVIILSLSLLLLLLLLLLLDPPKRN